MANGLKWKEFSSGSGNVSLEESQTDLMYMFFDETDMEAEEVYSLVFMDGNKISWQ